MPRTELRWRTAAEVSDPLAAAPRPSVLGNDDYLPEPCVLHPEPVTEYPAPHELPEDLAGRLHAWGKRRGVVYQYDLGVAPGCKVAGHAPWSFSDPSPMACAECGSGLLPLLTIDGREWDGGSKSWRPVEDSHAADPSLPDAGGDTHLTIGRGYSLQLYVCAASWEHPHVRNMQ
ncbi:hypothetical protein [Streptomyces sparsogenes]|uniref:DUF1963 domain-containing protein n=1 Tax=Streptomyces sparsogenes DSM 40356 TaxID=1331668 RepID=A0A1R1S582_9ACTN|nr:hypothetical protein [Streptomyces sparsogenes]OMI33457.1 hypothetical protein SPAR_41359 [Streptomyces sparsogenes DSM 40356]